MHLLIDLIYDSRIRGKLQLIVIRANNISFSFGVKNILKDVNFSIQNNDKIGLVGVNGAGKTTLVKLINGEYVPEIGDIEISKSLTISYLQQVADLSSNKSILEEVIDNFSNLIDMELELNELQDKMINEKDEEILKTLVNKHANITQKFSMLGGYEYTSRAKGILKGLGFSEQDFRRSVTSLSGGQKKRLQLAKLLNKEPDVLLLDEPTNHLDIDSIEWLEKFIKNYKKCIIIISHDRYFLNQTVNRIMEIENNRLAAYNGNYDEFMTQKEIQRNIQKNHYDNQQKEIARMEAFIKQQKQWNRERNIRAAESRQKAIDRIERVEKPEDLPDNIKFKFEIKRTSGNEVLNLKDVTMEYPNKKLFKNVSFDVMKKDRIFLLGENGVGKSTLLKIILGRLTPISGKIKLGTNVDMDYYAQELEGLNFENTIFEELLNTTNGLTRTDIHSVLASFLFKEDDISKKIKTLSGGEKGRVALCKIMLHKANFLLLDEPTNHLDISSKEVFEKVLEDYEGTLLIVSHDRYFIDKIATRIIEITDNGIIDVNGNYSFYKQYKENLKQEVVEQKEKEVTVAKEEYKNYKLEQKEIKKIQRQFEATEKKIEDLEQRLQEIKQEMAKDEVLTNYSKLQKLYEQENTIKLELEKEYILWEELSSKI